MTQQACTVKNLSVQFAHEALFQHLNFEMPAAQCAALIGRNGQGKSILGGVLKSMLTLNEAIIDVKEG